MQVMKKFLSYINIFSLDLNSRSYKSGLIRIFLSSAVMIAACLIRFNLTLSDPLINLLVSLPTIAIIILSILCLFVGAAECLQVSENLKRDRK